MMLYFLLFLFLLHDHSNMASAPSTKTKETLRSNRSSEECTLDAMFRNCSEKHSKNCSRKPSKSPSSRCSSNSRTAPQSPQFYTPKSGSPIAAVTVPIHQQPETLIPNPTNISSEPDDWVNVEEDLDRVKDRIFVKGIKPVTRNQTVTEFTNAIKNTITPAATAIGVLLKTISNE